MTTARQIFKATCDEAIRGKELRGVSVERVLNRLDIDAVLTMQHALAQQFILLMRDAAADVDVNRPAPTIGERMQRLASMRTISDKRKA